MRSPHWVAVVGGMFLFLAWSSLSLPAMFSLVASNLGREKHTMGIGVQSLTKRVPIIIGPIAGGLLIDRYGFCAGVKIGLAISILFGAFSLWLQSRLNDDVPAPPVRCPREFLATVRGFDPRLRRLLFSDILIRFCERIPYAWVVIYAMDHGGVSATQVGVLIAVETVVAMACYVPVAHLADRYGKEPFVIATFLFFTVFPADAAGGASLRNASARVRGARTQGVRRFRRVRRSSSSTRPRTRADSRSAPTI